MQPVSMHDLAGSCRLTALGRGGAIPWCTEPFRESLSYVSPSNTVMLPTAHMLLRGMLRGLLLYALAEEKPHDNDPIICSKTARNSIAVSFSCVTDALVLIAAGVAAPAQPPAHSRPEHLTDLHAHAGTALIHPRAHRLQQALPLHHQIRQVLHHRGAGQRAVACTRALC